jgi:glycosyltransferase involved in cell wall biosynthesis
MIISVVIPTKNRPSDVNELLASLLKQSVKPNEVVIVDDSTDLTTEGLVRKYRSVYSRNNVELRHIWDSDSSARARTLGGLVSKGEIIIYMDDDLIIRKDSIETLVKVLQRTGAMAAWGSVFFPDTSKSRMIKIFEIPYYRFVFGKTSSGGGLFAIRRRVLEDKVWFDENLSGYALGEDKDFAFNLLKHYGSCSVTQIENPILATNKRTLSKDKKYYSYLFGTTMYYSRKWGGTLKLMFSFWVTLVLCGFHMLNEGGRGKSSITKKEILETWLAVLKNLKFVFNGKLDLIIKSRRDLSAG